MINPYKLIAFTGHRPDKLNNEWEMNGPLSQKIFDRITEDMRLLNPTLGITGGAIGVDLIAANALYRLGIPFDVYVPFERQERLWRPKQQQIYHKILTVARNVIIISDKIDMKAFQQRNMKMVDDATMLYAVWDGTKGGTANTVRYAKSTSKKVMRIHPGDL